MQPTRPSASNVAIEADAVGEAYKADEANDGGRSSQQRADNGCCK